MTDQYHVVPWYNSDEWHTVYNDVYSDNSNKHVALNLLQMWKARCPSLPSGIESTLSLLQVHVHDENNDNEFANDQILRLAYSSAVMRFVNHMLDTETAKGNSLYNAAKSAGVPDWIVDLRHDTAHNNNLPSIALLRNACIICLQWLKKNYWDKHKECIQDYVSGQKESDYTRDENKITALIHFCSCLSICSQSKIKKLSDISDSDMQESIVNDVRDLFGDYIDLSNLKTVSLGSLINLINSHGKKILRCKDTTSYVNNALLGEESLFLSLELVEHLSKYDFIKSKLSKNYVKCFEVLLSFLHTNDLILDFILALVRMTQNEQCTKKAMLSALWVSEILAALKKSKQFVERANKMSTSGGVSNKKTDLKVLYHHWFPNEKLDRLVLDLQKPVPSKLTDINSIQPIISSYNPYLTYFVKDLLNLVDPHLPKQVCEKICRLARLISTSEKFPVQLSSAKIYTVEDLKNEDNNMENEIIKSDEVSHGLVTEPLFGGIWKLATKQNWLLCPIGKVPHQTDAEII